MESRVISRHRLVLVQYSFLLVVLVIPTPIGSFPYFYPMIFKGNDYEICNLSATDRTSDTGIVCFFFHINSFIMLYCSITSFDLIILRMTINVL